jgi:hypothetical protein
MWMRRHWSQGVGIGRRRSIDKARTLERTRLVHPAPRLDPRLTEYAGQSPVCAATEGFRVADRERREIRGNVGACPRGAGGIRAVGPDCRVAVGLASQSVPEENDQEGAMHTTKINIAAMRAMVTLWG